VRKAGCPFFLWKGKQAAISLIRKNFFSGISQNGLSIL
jgi:hypothetical protein